MVTVTVKTTAT